MTAVLIFLLLTASPALPQCSWVPRYSGQFRTTAFDVSTAGDGYLWVATGYGVQLFDVSAPGEPELLDSVALPGLTRVVHAVPGGIAYAGTGSRIAVVRREGDSLRLVRTVDAGGTVQDLALATYLFAATAKGIAHFDLLDPENPVRTSAVLPSTSPSVTSLVVAGSTLYAADGDATVEQYTIVLPSVPQRTGSIDSLTRSTAVHFAGGFLYVSDQFGQFTDVFSGETRIARVGRGSTSLAAGPGNLRFLAGPDRVVRAADFSIPASPVDLLELRLPVTEGTENAIQAMALAGSNLYVAAGDIGLVVIDAAAMAPPFPLASYRDGATASVAGSGGKGWFTTPSGTILQQSVDPSGVALVAERSWDGGSAARVHDVAADALLSTSGSTATLWSLAPQAPVASLTATFPAGVRTGVIRGNGIVVLLVDGTVWTAAPAPQQLGVPAMSAMARAGSAIGLLESREEGKTVLHYYPAGDFTAEPRRTTVDGIAIGGLALGTTRAALFTFSGVNVVDLASGGVNVVPWTSSGIPRQVAFAGDDLLVLGDRELLVYEDAAAPARRLPLPSEPAAMAASAPQALFATTEGRMVVSYLEELPEASVRDSSSFYRDAAGSTGRLALSGGARTDLFSTLFGAAPHYVQGIGAAGMIGMAFAGDTLYTLSASAVLTAWSRAGVPMATRTFDEGADAQPLAVDGVAGTLWVSFSKGCLSGGCRKETLVIDPSSLATTATINGGAVDAVSSGTKAWALFDLPDEVRVLDVSDPLHPAQLASAAAPATARSLAHGAGKVHVLGDRIYAFHETTLAAAGAFLTPVSPTATHRVRIEGTCAVVTGRGPDPELYDVTAWTAQPLPASLPSPARALLHEAGRLTILTDHSVEIWSTAPLPSPPKRRAVR